MPTQLSGAEFLAARKRAFLWDEPRVGKTGAAILAAKKIGAQKILVVTTPSGCGVWARAFPEWWSTLGGFRGASVFGPAMGQPDTVILSWGKMDAATIADPILQKTPWDLIILDEDQRAVNPAAARSVALYGQAYEEGRRLIVKNALVKPEHRVWHLSGDPAPHDLGNLWLRMRASCPEQLLDNPTHGWPNVLKFTDFRSRYCVVRKKLIAGVYKDVVFGGQHADELNMRLRGFYLRRTQQDVGIQPPRYEFFPLTPTTELRAKLAAVGQEPKLQALLDRIEDGETEDIDMHLGVHRRLLGTIKAELVVEAAKDAFEDGVKKLVIAYWHKDVGDILHRGLAKYGVVRVDGSSSPNSRANCETEFRKPRNRVFLGQIEAAGEAIDLSPANELWFCETTFRPKDMHQMALRITNVGQRRNTFVKVCTIEGSLDEAMQRCVVRLWNSIRQVVS
ncbi:MAG TPA: helicase-related protein [Rhizomicrobium sp.]|nr:helicase-related protein [Rhizomicrobium sp.]